MNQTRGLDLVSRHPSAVLLAAQLLTVLAWPFLSGSGPGLAVLGVVQLLAVAVAIWAVRASPVLTLVAVGFGVPAMVFSVLDALHPGTDWIVLTSACLHAPFYFYISYAMIAYLFHDDVVSNDEIFAIGAAFTVVAWGFASVFAGVEVVWPGSFGGGLSSGHGSHDWFDLLFLSFSNLTSVGLSDIVPVLPHARSVVMVEQVAGVMYVGLVVARLVGLTINRRRV